jgi:hypothetical protein
MLLDDPEGTAARLLRSRWLLPAAGIVTLGLLLLASISWCNNRFALQVVSRLAEITASAEAKHSIGVAMPSGMEIRLYGTGLAERPPELAGITKSPNGIRLTADKVVLDYIEVQGGTVLTFTTTQDGSPDLRLTGGGSIGLTLSGIIHQIGDDGHLTQLAVADRPFGIDIAPTDTVDSARLVLVGGGGLKGIAIYDQPVRGLRFSRPRASDNDQRLPFQSELINGTLQLLDTTQNMTLRPRELVWLEDVSATVARLDMTADGVAVDASGHARSIGLGPPRAGLPPRPDRDLTPSVLGYLMGQHELKLLWGVAITALAALWKARQWGLKWRK